MSCKHCEKDIVDTCVKCFNGCCEQHLTTLIHPVVLKIVTLPIHKQCLPCKN